MEIPAYAEATGTARLQVSVFNAAHQDHVLEELPVYRPAARQGFATYGVVEDAPALHTLQVPPDVLPGFGAFSVTTSSTRLQMLVDSCLSLREVRWEDPSSLSAVILANTAMRDVLYAFGVPGLPTPQEADQEIQDDIDTLLEYQNQDGGFPWWRKGRPSRVYVSVQAVHALVQAHNEGYRVDSEAMDRGLDYLRNIRQAFESGVGPETRRLITAYALWIRSQADDVDSVRASRLLAEAPWDEHPLEVLGWSMLVLARDPSAAEEVADLLRFVLNRVEETSGKASFIQGYRETDGYTVFQSSRRGEGAMLQAVMTVDPESDVIPKIVSGMLGGLNRQGHWGSPIDNLSLLLAMSQYFRQYEADEPDFVAHVWLDETLVASDEYRGRSTATHRLDSAHGMAHGAEPGTDSHRQGRCGTAVLPVGLAICARGYPAGQPGPRLYGAPYLCPNGRRRGCLAGCRRCLACSAGIAGARGNHSGDPRPPDARAVVGAAAGRSGSHQPGPGRLPAD